MKECEICGRSIKSGRKYCYEHRHTAQAGAIHEERLIDEARDIYYKYKKKKIDIKMFLIGIGILFLILIVVFNVEDEILSTFLIFSLSLSGAITLIILLVKRKKIWDKIAKRDPEYIEWVKEWIRIDREHKEFKKSLLK